MDATLNDFLTRCLLLDLETGPDGSIQKIGAIRRGKSFLREGPLDADRALAELDSFAAGAHYVLGHNLLGHDIPTLRAHAPALALLRRPVVDTLYISPLAFPENPYHRLVKGYKLVRDTVSDPLADSRLAERVFREQWEELSRRQGAGDSDLLGLYRFCFLGATELEVGHRGGSGLAAALAAMGVGLPGTSAAISVLRERWQDCTCATAAGPLALRHFADPRLRPVAAYATAWLGVAGARSVLPGWVRHRFAETTELLHGLRDTPCNDPHCDWCRQVQNPQVQLKRYFDFDAFRPHPVAPDGGSLQEAIVTCGLGSSSLLAILPTGGGKSLCFQLPALSRNFRRGVLTVVISPLQALMKDQVDNLTRKTGTTSAAALYGLLTPPERGDVLERVRLGDVAILYVSPEQLRNSSFRNVLEQREIGSWVFDEAHCLSKWGHDFRPDYLYAARFIKELAERQGTPVPPVACFTATAKAEVTAEILIHFRDVLGLDLRLFEGGVERDNLTFEVQLVRVMEKEARVHRVLGDNLSGSGAAIVYAAKRRRTEELSEYLQSQGWAAAAFHAGLAAPEKKRIQDAFIAGELQVICATNAFGMGVDKENVRLVVHLDIPGSLENYVQEAGRAGRDREPALCVLLYDEQDVETQFRMEAMSELTRADIADILQALKQAQRPGDDNVVLTSGELLRDEDLRIGFDAGDRHADTQVRIAVAWLERAGFVERNENRTRVFQGRPAVGDLDEARRKIGHLGLSAAQTERWLAVLEALMNSDPDEGITADELATLAVFRPPVEARASWDSGETPGQRVLRTLHDMAGAGLLHKGPQLSAFLRHKVKNHSKLVFQRVCVLERAMIAALREEAPDAENREWQTLSLRQLNQRLLDQDLSSNPEILRKLLDSLSRDGRGLAGGRGSLEFRQTERDQYLLRLHRGWSSLTTTAERRQAVAGLVLQTLLGKLPADAPARAELLVSFGADELTAALRSDIALAASVKDPLAAVDRGLMFLHEQGAIILQRGLAVFRQAMTIRVLPEAHGKRYSKTHFEPLAQHYGERIFQIHVVDEYARLGLKKMRQALELVTAYFTLDKSSFVRRFFPDRSELLERATTAESFRRIVDALGNPDQAEIVAAADEGNRLVLAGPGSGKTRVVVHRCAYLLRVKRVDPRSVLVLCFNHSTALELRQRLKDLVAEDTRGVAIQTYHGLAMRLTGTSFATRMERRASEGLDFDALIPAAIDLLEGRVELPGIAPDALRDHLLAGYRHILVDEYQDIDEDQYRLIRAIAKRTEGEGGTTLLGVGDDDQSIYAFRGANVRHIREFQREYQAKLHYLVENYRSSGHIVAAGNALIAHNRDRMKTGQPIRVDRGRRDQPPGGRWQKLDPHSRGRVVLLEVADEARQAAALTARMEHLRAQSGCAWSDFAVLAPTHAGLAPMRALCEARGVPVSWREKLPPLHRMREIAVFLARLKALGQESCTAASLAGLIPENAGPWRRVLDGLCSAWSGEAGTAEVPAARMLEFCYEGLAAQRRDGILADGVLLSTLHGAKGLEFPHVLIADGERAGDDNLEEERRLLYVGMTRARETLTLGALTSRANSHLPLIDGDWLLRVPVQIDRPPGEILDRRYERLTLADLDLGFTGRKPPTDPVHARLAALQTGDWLLPRAADGRVLLCDRSGLPVARLSARASGRWLNLLPGIEAIRVIGLLCRRREDGDPVYRNSYRSETWEVPLVEIIRHQS